MIVIVGGVSGSGKSTVGALLAGRLGWRFGDADDFHSDANVAKMRAGIPLTDEDRLPWLHSVAGWLDERIAAGESAVVACSVLKRSYRDLMRDGRPSVVIAYLQVPRAELERRLTLRHRHFFPETLLDSQLGTLELPSAEEHQALTIDVSGTTDETTDKVLATLRAAGLTLDS